MQVFGIDIGGSGVKGAPVDLDAGDLAGKRYRLPTPQPSTPDEVLDAAATVVASFDYRGPVGCAVPCVVQNGITLTAANIDGAWIGAPAAGMLAEKVGQRVTMLNDADAAGIAEMRYGAGAGEMGLVLMLTFGTGIGSALFYRGVLVPNTELGHVEFRGMEGEEYAAARLVERDAMKLDWWAGRANEYLQAVERFLYPELIIFGGGISKRWSDFVEYLQTRARLVPAQLRNNAGIVGAALAAHQATNGAP